jgi:hypothetical protein
VKLEFKRADPEFQPNFVEVLAKRREAENQDSMKYILAVEISNSEAIQRWNKVIRERGKEFFTPRWRRYIWKVIRDEQKKEWINFWSSLKCGERPYRKGNCNELEVRMCLLTFYNEEITEEERKERLLFS